MLLIDELKDKNHFYDYFLESSSPYDRIKSYNFKNDSTTEYLFESSIVMEKYFNFTLIENMYFLEKPDEVKRFLLRCEFLSDILFEAPSKIRQIFGDKVSLFLELVIDPEEDCEELIIVIRTNYPPEEAFTLERQLFDSWFLSVIDDTH